MENVSILVSCSVAGRCWRVGLCGVVFTSRGTGDNDGFGGHGALSLAIDMEKAIEELLYRGGQSRSQW